MKFIFAGTTEFGIPTIEKLIADGHELLFVVTNPDKPVGRKQELSPTAIKKWVQSKNIQVLTPEKIIDAKLEIINSNPDLMLVAAYGQIIPKEILDIPKHGSVNIHGSILPKYRGAAPIQFALLNGDKTTGVTLIKMDEKMDHGPILATAELEIQPDDNFASLYKKIAELSATLCAKVLPQYVDGRNFATEQAHEQASFTKMLRKEDGKIDWTRRAEDILNQIRALNPEPGTWTTLDGKTVKILEAELLNETKIELPGKLYRHAAGLAAKAQDQSLLLILVQPEGKQPMTGKDFLNGLKNLEQKHLV